MGTGRHEPIAIIGSGPAGLASALSLHTAGFDVRIFERQPEPRPAGNILNLWPPAIKALREMGVDVVDLGAPCDTTFRNTKDRVRVHVNLSAEVIQEYGGGFIGMLRPDLYARMLAAMPPEVIVGSHELYRLDDTGDGVTLHFSNGETLRTPLVIGADGLHSTVRRRTFGDVPIRDHGLHVIGGYTFEVPEGVDIRSAVIRHGRHVQGSYTGIRSHGRDGIEWWMLEAWAPDAPPPADLRAHALELTKGFPEDLRQLITNSTADHVFRWPIRDLGVPPEDWAKGRIVLAGDAVHATSPYAAYGAGMSIVDGYFLAQALTGTDLADTAAVGSALEVYRQHRIQHTREQVEQSYMLGRVFHRIPKPLRAIRDLVLDHTPFLQRQVGDKTPASIEAQLVEMGADILHPAAA